MNSMLELHKSMQITFWGLISTTHMHTLHVLMHTTYYVGGCLQPVHKQGLDLISCLSIKLVITTRCMVIDLDHSSCECILLSPLLMKAGLF